MSERGVCLLGATGSVGASALDIIARHPTRFRLVAASAGRNIQRLAEICADHLPDVAVIADAALADELNARLKPVAPHTRVLAGAEGMNEAVNLDGVDTVMAGIVGAAGLAPTLSAVAAGKRVLLANKEALVMAGDLFMRQVKASGAELLPIDSEHNAVFQCLKNDSAPVRIVLTASGGPFLNHSVEALADVKPEAACKHPTWDMGRKISVDSATLMNKGLEVIEASWLFGLPAARIEVVVHPQSIVHSLVEFADGSVLAQLANPDMRVPIAHAMGWPERIESGAAPLDIAALGALQFEAPDVERFPCLRLARTAHDAGGTTPAALNAANEVAVEAFLNGQLRFDAIPAVIDKVLCDWQSVPASDLDTVLAADFKARRLAQEFTEKTT